MFNRNNLPSVLILSAARATKDLLPGETLTITLLRLLATLDQAGEAITIRQWLVDMTNTVATTRLRNIPTHRWLIEAFLPGLVGEPQLVEVVIEGRARYGG
jgi:hypothetical protein